MFQLFKFLGLREVDCVLCELQSLEFDNGKDYPHVASCAINVLAAIADIEELLQVPIT